MERLETRFFLNAPFAKASSRRADWTLIVAQSPVYLCDFRFGESHAKGKRKSEKLDSFRWRPLRMTRR